MNKHLFYEIYSNDFVGFLGKCFTTLCPGETFLMNWHLSLLAEYLAAVERGECRRLIINLPPRSLKSLMISVAWPAWLLGKAPTRKIMAASYAAALAEKHSVDCRVILQSGWYQEVFPATRLCSQQNEKHKFLTTQYGMRMATSIWGSATGEGGDILIADDPMNPLQAKSAKTRQFVKDWFDHTFSTRLNDKKRGAIVIVMQRLHEDDLCGHLLSKGGWEILRLPAIAQEQEHWRIGTFAHERASGVVLHEQREPMPLLERAKIDLGSAQFAAQYLQTPQSEEGNMIKLEWFARY